MEIMAARGFRTLLFGPMKPVGLVDPQTGRQPFAVVQLRAENREGTLYNLVGFQTKLKYGAQERVFRLIPGLEQAEFVRLGSIHRNTFIHSPGILSAYLNFLHYPQIFLAGQISGVEGYVESAAMGLLAGINAARQTAVPPADHPAPGDRPGGPHRPPHQHRHQRFPAHERQLRAVFAVRGPHPQETPGRGLCGAGVGGAGGVDERKRHPGSHPFPAIKDCYNQRHGLQHRLGSLCHQRLISLGHAQFTPRCLPSSTTW